MDRILLNVDFSVAKGEAITAEGMRAIIDRADAQQGAEGDRATVGKASRVKENVHRVEQRSSYFGCFPALGLREHLSSCCVVPAILNCSIREGPRRSWPGSASRQQHIFPVPYAEPE
jgi:hypothetical protein